MRRSELLLGTLLGLILAGVTVYGLWVWLTPGPDAQSQRRALVAGPPAAPIWEGFTAASGYELALAKARDWANDATLVTATATWPAGTDFSGGRAPWNYTFFAPSRGEAALITVSDQAAYLVSVQDHQPMPALPADVSRWQIDSKQVIDHILSLDGSTSTDMAKATLVLTLSNEVPMQWEAVLLPGNPVEVVSLRLDAETGQLLAASH